MLIYLPTGRRELSLKFSGGKITNSLCLTSENMRKTLKEKRICLGKSRSLFITLNIHFKYHQIQKIRE